MKHIEFFENYFEDDYEIKISTDNKNMTTQEKIDLINKKHGWNYQVNKHGRVYDEFMGVKTWIKISDLVSSSKSLLRTAIINDNRKQIKRYLENNDFKKTYINKEGTSSYWSNGIINVRLSDHEMQSTKHDSCDVNAFSDKKDGYLDVIAKMKATEKK